MATDILNISTLCNIGFHGNRKECFHFNHVVELPNNTSIYLQYAIDFMLIDESHPEILQFEVWSKYQILKCGPHIKPLRAASALMHYAHLSS
jgi:hypothetical protein